MIIIVATGVFIFPLAAYTLLVMLCFMKTHFLVLFPHLPSQQLQTLPLFLLGLHHSLLFLTGLHHTLPKLAPPAYTN